jgi:hypothetical protein
MRRSAKILDTKELLARVAASAPSNPSSAFSRSNQNSTVTVTGIPVAIFVL